MNNNVMEILAKKDNNKSVTLIDHCIETANTAKHLIEMLTDDKRIISLTVIAALFHDIGKAVQDFQKHLNDSSFKEYIPHNILSAAIFAKYLAFNNDMNAYSRNIEIVVKSILYHHPTQFYKIKEQTIDYSFLKDNFNITNIDEANINEILNYLINVYKSYDFDIELKFNNINRNIRPTYFNENGYAIQDCDHIFFITNNVLKFADFIVSSGYSYDSYINRINSDAIIFNKPLNYDDRFEKQINMAQDLFKYKLSVFNSQTGFGKTMLGLRYLLNNNKRGYWICPRNTIAEGIYQTICKEISALNLTSEVKVGLLLTNEWIYGDSNSDIVVTNIDNFIRPSLKADSNTFSYNMLYCNCIFDEFHEFVDDEAIMAAFITILRARNKINSKTLLLSATPIHDFYHEFQKNNDFKYLRYNYEPILAKKIKFIYSDNINVDDLKNQNYFISVNTVKKAQNIYTENIINNIIHARYSKTDLNDKLNLLFSEHGKNKNSKTSWVGTNIISTGIDVSFGNMIISWPTPERFIQAGGRCNRWNECLEIPIWHIVKDERDINEKYGVDAFSDQEIARNFYYFLTKNIKNNEIITLKDLYDYRDLFYKTYEEMFNRFFNNMVRKSFKNLAKISYEYSKNYDNDEDVKFISNKTSLRKSDDIISFFFKVKDNKTNEFINEPIQGDNRMINFNLISSNQSLDYTYKAIKKFGITPYFKNKNSLDKLMLNYNKFFNVLINKAKNSKTPFLIANNYYYNCEIGLFKRD